MHLPWAGGLVGVINSLGFWKYLSPSSVVLLAACLGGLMLVLAAWLAYRSEFATRYGLVAPVLMWLLFGPMTTSIAVLMLSMGGDLAWRGWTVVSVGGSLLLTFMVAAVQQWRRRLPGLGALRDVEDDGHLYEGLDPPHWQEVFAALEAMPPNARSLRSAILATHPEVLR